MALRKIDRFQTIHQFLIVSLLVFDGLRVWLVATSWEEITQESGNAVLSTLASGLMYDISFTLNLCVSIALILLLIPRRASTRNWFKYFTLASYYLLLCILFFTLAAELMFWKEFNVRFNFISVYYLVYRHEITQ